VIAALVVGFVVIWFLRPIGWSWWTQNDLLETTWVGTHSLAWPWHLPIGAGIAFGVVMLGRRPGDAHRSAGDSPAG
jgi:hypothetical protein